MGSPFLRETSFPMSDIRYEKIDPGYEAQVRLVLMCLPAMAGADCFALKGGTSQSPRQAALFTT